jgi:hypothetical protein
LHPCILTAYDPKTKSTVSRGKLYFLPNDGNALLDRFKEDFPGWKELAVRPTKWAKK